LAGLLVAAGAQAADFSGWGRRMEIKFTGYTKPEPLTNFPAAVVLNTNLAGFGYSQFLSGQNADLRFTDDTLTNELRYEVESWITNGASYVWVQVPLLTNNASVWMHWRQTGQSAPAYTTNGTVWDPGYVAVYHQPSSSTFRDATSNANHGVATATTNAVGAINGAQAYQNANSSYVTCGSSPSFNSITQAVTLSAWVNLRTSANYPMILTRVSNGFEFRFSGSSRNLEFMVAGTWLTDTVPISLGQWTHVAAIFDDVANTNMIFVNGRLTKANSVAGSMNHANNPTYLGRRSDGYYFDGYIDETRVSRVARSTNWVWATWMNGGSNAVFQTYGAVVVSPLPKVANLDATNVTVSSVNLNGFLHDTGTSDTAISAYWGETDGGTNADLWSFTNTFGGAQPVGPLTVGVGVEADRYYFFTYRGQNGAGDGWATPSSGFLTDEIWVQGTGDASENGTRGTVTVYRAAGMTAGPLQVYYSVTGGTASNGVDYVTPSGSVVIPAGAQSAAIEILPLWDPLPEGTETITVSLSTGPYLIGTTNTATINLTNYDPPVYYVALHGSDTTGVGTWTSPWRTPQFAVTNAVAFGEIRVGEGLYATNVNFSSATRTNLTLKGGYNTNDWSWSPAARPTILKPTSTAQDIILLSTPHHRIVGFTLTGGNRGIYRTSAGNEDTQFTVEHCVVSNNASHGIWISMTRSAVAVRNCLIVKNGGDGIRFNVDNAPFGSPIYSCTIADNTGNGIFMNYLTTAVDVKNCIVVRNGQYGLQQNPTQNQNAMTVSFSTIYGNTLGDFISKPETLRASAQAIGVGAGVLCADPRFAAVGDYHLGSASPCVDRGAVLASVSNDLELAARPALPDMGCYESAYSAVARSAAVYVDAAKADDTGDGASWATAKKTVGSGVAATASNGVCWVAAGAYRENVFMPGGVTLSGTNRDATVLYQTGAWHVVSFPEGAATLRRVTVTGGVRGADVNSTSNTLEDCALGRNAYGVYVSRLLTVLNNCYLTNNTFHAVWGAGLSAPHARGIVARNCLIAGNGNSGIYIGWDNSGGDHTWWLNCTIVSNGVHGYQCNVYGQNAYFTNTILALNRQYGSYADGWGGDNQYANYCSAYGNPSGTFFNTRGGARLILGANMLYSDPAFMSPTDFHLTNSSPLIDAGQNLSGWALTNDLDGTARTNAYDIGCYETAFSPPPRYDVVYADIARPDDTGEGTNWATAKKTIAAAQAVMTATGTCYVAAGLYSETVSLPANTALIGLDRDTTIISNAANVVTMSGSGSRIRELTIWGGTRTISMTGPSNYVERCIVRGGTESGVYLAATGNRLADCTLRNNGYGLYVPGGSYALYTVDRCIVMSNTSHGIYQTGGNLGSPSGRIFNTLIVGNGYDGFSSSVDNSVQGGTWLYNCTIANNASNGVYDAYLTISFELRNCIVANNGLNGLRQLNNGHHTFSVYNTTLFGNRGGNCSFTLANGTLRLYSGCLSADPLFLGPGDYQLQAVSPVIGRGATNAVLAVVSNSLDGAAWAGAYDMGCYKATNTAVARLAAVYVNGATGDDAADGAGWGTAKKTLGSGVAATAPGGTCYAAAGTYGDLVLMPARVTLEGADRDSVIVTGSWFVVYLPETNSVVRKLTVQNGLYGVFQNGKLGSVEQCVLRANTIGHYVDGVYASGWNTRISETVVTNNSSHGLYASQAGVSARNCLFARNGGNGVLIIADNSQVYSYMDFCTFADNTGSGYEDNHASHWRTAITNCIATGNGVNGIRFQRLNNDAIAYSCVYGNTGGDFSSTNLTYGAGMITNQLPGFALGKFELNELSPCLDVGAALLAVTNDVLGVRRPIAAKRPAVGTGYDMGAYELNPPPKGSVFVVR
jgi:hypothetical protein